MVVGGEDPPDFMLSYLIFQAYFFLFQAYFFLFQACFFSFQAYFFLFKGIFLLISGHISCNTVMSGLGSWRGWCFEGMNPPLSAETNKIFFAMLSYQISIGSEQLSYLGL